MLLRQLEYLSVLAKERHFGRAAAACHVSQPALSVAIRKLEAELGVELVRRDRRHADLTPQGRELLSWTRQTLSSVDGLAAEAARLAGHLVGRLRLGVIPTALPAVAEITEKLLSDFPSIDLEVRSLSSIEIAAQLESFGIDAGITYLDNEPLGRLLATPIYREGYAFLSSKEGEEETIAWGAIDEAELCLLTAEMQNRRIIEAALRESGARPRARIETTSISALLSFIRAGWSSIVSETWLKLYGVPPGMRALRLVEPDLGYTIGVVTRETELLPPTVKALLERLPAEPASAAGKVASIVLAAGAASRFGGRKQLAQLDGRPLLEHAVAGAAQSASDLVVVVLGANAEAIEAGVDLGGALVVRCPDWKQGRHASLRAGLAALDPDVTAALITLGDEPLLPSAAGDRLIEARRPGLEVLRATYDGRPGHPVLVERSLFAKLIALSGPDASPAKVLREAGEEAVPCDDLGGSVDVDTRTDLAELEAGNRQSARA